MRLLEAAVVVVCVVNVVVAVVVAAVVVNDVVVPLLVVAHADNIQSWSIDVQLRLLKGNVEFLWVGGWYAKSFVCQTHLQLRFCVVIELALTKESNKSKIMLQDLIQKKIL